MTALAKLVVLLVVILPGGFRFSAEMDYPLCQAYAREAPDEGVEAGCFDLHSGVRMDDPLERHA